MQKIVSLFLVLAMALSMAAVAGAETTEYNSPLEAAMGYAAPVADGAFWLETSKEFDGRPAVSLHEFAQTFTQEEIDQVKAGGYTCAIVTQDAYTDWGRGLVRALESQLGNLGIEILGISDAAHDQQKLIEYFESYISLKPDVILTNTIDGEAQKGVMRTAIEAGIKIVCFSGSAPAEFELNKDFYGHSLSDEYTMEYVGAKALCEALNDGDQALYFSFSTWTPGANIRYKAFQDAIKESGKAIEEITPTANISGSITQAADMAENYAIGYPKLRGISGMWDEPCMAALGVMNNLGHECYAGASGISEGSLLSMLRETGFAGSGGESSYLISSGAVALTVGALCGHENPYYILANAVGVNAENVPESWDACFKSELPDNLQKAWEDYMAKKAN